MADTALRNTTSILDIPISRFGMDEAQKYCAERALGRRGGYVCFANVHSVTEANRDSRIHRALSEATLTVADGVPLVWVSLLRDGEAIGSRVCGPDFMARFIRENPALDYGFVGGEPGAAEELAARFGLNATCYCPPFRPFSPDNAREDWNAVVGRGSRAPSVVWVGLGAPKQELWMNAVAKLAPETLFFGVGAAFDFLTGRKKRAPVWVQRLGFEWFFRLAQEPRRLWRRYFVTNLLFGAFLIRQYARRID